MPTLLLSARQTDDAQSLWRACIALKWEVVRVHGWHVPAISPEDVAVYGEPLFAHHVAQTLGLKLQEPSLDWLPKLALIWRGRVVRLTTLAEARHTSTRAFIKPADEKCFDAKVYSSGADLPAPGPLPENLAVLIQEIVEWKIEFRCFILNRKVVTLSPYWRDGRLAKAEDGTWSATDEELAAAKEFSERVLADPSVEIPAAVVMDVGIMANGNWAVIESNAAFSSGMYGAMPREFCPCSCMPVGQIKLYMGATRDDFIKYPRTPHLFGSKGTDDDKHLGRKDSEAFIADPSLIVEEKVDGTNVGIHFTTGGRMVLQCRGHEITEGMHPQYDLFKQWTSVKRPVLERMLGGKFILYGEWLYAKHSVHYRKLPHYFFEFDIYDKDAGQFLDLNTRLRMLDGTGLHTVPVVHRSRVTAEELQALIGPSAFDSAFDNPVTGRADNLMEGLYVRTEANGFVTGRAKLVRPEFVEKVKQSEHWQHQKMIPNLLEDGADIWL